VQNALILLVMLQIKHMFADFFLQTPRMLEARSRYLHIGRVQHVGLHALGSAVGFVIIGTALPLLLLILLAEGLAHYHIDWAKAVHADVTQQTPVDGGFWRAIGVDQTMHQLTYVAMIWVWIEFSVG
jgi:hypothetical protein